MAPNGRRRISCTNVHDTYTRKSLFSFSISVYFEFHKRHILKEQLHTKGGDVYL